MSQLAEDSTTDATESQTDGIYLPCGLCAIWLTRPDDSFPVETGICPRKQYPDCMTNATKDGCRNPVWPKE